MPISTVPREGRSAPFLEDLHVNFIRNLDTKQDEPEYWTISHLKLNGVYWGLVALHLMDRGDELPKKDVIEFVMKCHNVKENDESNSSDDYGFGGNVGHDSHLIYTLSALQILAMCGGRETLEKYINKDRMLAHLASLHDPSSGSFKGDNWGEVDTRFSYIAIQILAILGYVNPNKGDHNRGKLYPKEDHGFTSSKHQLIPKESGSSQKATLYIDLDMALNYITRCQNFDGGYGTVPGAESHSGQIFCCVGALSLMGRMDLISASNKENEVRLKKWLAQRQTPNGGLNGRPEKLEDVCYSWWVLSAMANLNILDWIDRIKLIDFILKSQDDETGGIADRPGDYPDVFHCNFGICGLSLLGFEGLKEVDPRFCLPKETVDSLNFEQ